LSKCPVVIKGKITVAIELQLGVFAVKYKPLLYDPHL